MKYVILIPIYNDRESLKLLVENINSQIKDLIHEVSLVVINDASSQQIIDTSPNLENIRIMFRKFPNFICTIIQSGCTKIAILFILFTTNNVRSCKR